MLSTWVRTRFDLRGDLSITPVSSIFCKIFANRLTGTLVLDVDENTRTIYFNEGIPTFGRSRLDAESLAKQLVRSKLATSEQVEAALQQEQPNLGVGVYLVNQGVLTSIQLEEAHTAQVRSVCLSCFILKAGPYEFTQRKDWLGIIPEHPQNPIGIVSDGIRDTVDANELAVALDKYLDSYLVKTEKYDDFLRYFPTSERDGQWISVLDGTRTLRELTVETKDALVDFLKLVYTLHSADIIDFEGSPRTTAERSSKKPPLLSQWSSAGRELGPAVKLADKERRGVESAIAHFLNVLESGDEYGLLDVTPSATPEEVRQGYIRASGRIRPDCFDVLTPTVKKNALTVHEAMKSAFNAILLRHLASAPNTAQGPPSGVRQPEKAQVLDNQSGFARRTGADQGARHGAPVSRSAPPDTPFGPSAFPAVLFEAAKRLAKESQWAEAWEQIRAARNSCPDDLEFLALDAWIRYNMPAADAAKKLRSCASALHRVVSEAPDHLDAHYYLGRVFESARRYGEALTCYYAIQDRDPRADYPQLAKRVRLLQLRKITPRPIPTFDDDSSGLDFESSQLKTRTVNTES